MMKDRILCIAGDKLEPQQKASVHDEFLWMIERGFVLSADWLNKHCFYFRGDKFIGVYDDREPN